MTVSRRGWGHRLRSAGRFVVYPLAAAAYPILAIYAVNLREMIPLGQFWAPLLFALVASAIVLAALRLAFGDWHRAGLMTTALAALFFAYGPAWDAARGLVAAGHATLLLTWLLVATVAAAVIARLGSRRAAVATPALNLAVAALLIGNMLAIGRFQLAVRADTGTTDPETSTAAAASLERRPDVYWIVLDRYGSRDVIDAYYDHDISSFLDELRDRGFYVAAEATANYLKTAPSLVSARNMEYLDPDALRQRASADDDWGPLYRDLSRSFRLLEVLRAHDYRFVYLGTYWDFTASHPEADINYVYEEATSEFGSVLRNHTMLRAMEALAPDSVTDWRRERWNLTRFQWDRLHDAMGLGGPKLVHAHFSLPHDPYVFNADGSFVTEETERERSTEENYVQHVEYANTEVLDFVDALLSADPANPPIIVIQSEEGPWPHNFRMNEVGFDWAEDATDAELHEKFGILSAFHLPGLPGAEAERAGLYPSVSLVNQWRLILNHFFGTEYERLPDRNLIWPGQYDIYTFIDVTERIEQIQSRAP